MTTDAMDNCQHVALSIPRGDMALSAMRVVVGWVASCNDLPLDSLDDINLAVETLLAEEPSEGRPFTLSLSIGEGCVMVTLDGLENLDLEANLAARRPFEPTLRCPLDVRLFLDALVEKYDVVGLTDEVFGVRMQKRIR